MNKYGIIIMSGFAAIWSAWGMTAAGPISLLWLLVPLAVSGALIAAALRLPDRRTTAERQYVGRVVGWASCIEGVAIFVATNALINLGAPGYIVVATLAIVGLHFLPLAYYLGMRSYYVTGTALTALAASGCAIGGDATRLLVLGTGAAVLLWLTCLMSFARSPADATA